MGVVVNLSRRTTSDRSVSGRPLAPERVKPWIRPFYYGALGSRARILARLRPTRVTDGAAPIFIIGCGRSGTSLLGEFFAAHPAVRYLYEPYDLWAAIEPAADFLQKYSRGEHHCLLDSDIVTAAAMDRFRRLMSVPGGLVLVEKSPINTLRIGYLDAVAPGARFVHIARDGIDVAYSIEQKAAITKRIAFRGPLNAWWGVADAKWAALARDGIAAGYYPDEVHQLTTDTQRGAYEWLVSIREVRAWRTPLGSRFIEIRLADLIKDPRPTLTSIFDRLVLPLPGEEWWTRAITRISPVINRHNARLALPSQMRADFNKLQTRYGFAGRAGEYLLEPVAVPHYR